MPLSWDMSHYIKKLRKLRYHQKLRDWPLYHYIRGKFCYQVYLIKNNAIEKIGPKIILNMSWNWPNWEQLRALAYNLNLYHLYTVTQHNKVLVSATIKKFRFFQWFLKILNFADVLLRENQDLVDRISFLVTGNNTQLVWNRVVCRFWCSTK